MEDPVRLELTPPRFRAGAHCIVLRVLNFEFWVEKRKAVISEQG
jgi:hypothetical protein